MEAWEEKVARFCVTKNYLSPQHWDYLKEKKKSQSEKKNLLEMLMEEYHWSLEHVQYLYNTAMSMDESLLVDLDQVSEPELENTYTLVDYSLKKGKAKILTEEEMVQKNGIPSNLLSKTSSLVSSEAVASQCAKALVGQEILQISYEPQGIFSKASPLISGDKMASQFSKALLAEKEPALPKDPAPALEIPSDQENREEQKTKSSSEEPTSSIPSEESKPQTQAISIAPAPIEKKYPIPKEKPAINKTPYPSVAKNFPKKNKQPQDEMTEDSFATAKVLLANKKKEKKKIKKNYKKLWITLLLLILLPLFGYVGFRVYTIKIKQENAIPQAEVKKISGFTYLRSFECITPIQNYTIYEYRHDYTGIEFVLLPGGAFWMGSDKGDASEKPVHQVTLSSFLISKFEVTQSVWKKIMKSNDSYHKGDNKPVECVTWDECQRFCNRTGLKLPTESQWEYACRAMTRTKYYWGDSTEEGYGWHQGNSNQSTQAVGSKKPNGFGLYDMVGNVWEWCQDGWNDNHEGSPKNGSARFGDDQKRVVRGGCFSYGIEFCRSSARSWLPSQIQYKDVGFRVCAEVD